MRDTKIEWTDSTWNPIAGCSVVSPGCTNCYAMRMAHRLTGIGSEKYAGTTRISGGRAKWNGKIKIHEKAMDTPKHWKKGRHIFVNSMSDLFHEKLSLKVIRRIFEIMKDTPQHTYQILTKRAERLEEISPKLRWAHNIWMGVSVESKDYKFRINHLRRTGARIKFLSLEPLIAPLGCLHLYGIDWVIVGGESGQGARPMEADWVRSIRDQCIQQKVAFHFKQWGGVNKKKTGRILDNRTWNEFPQKG